MNKLFLLAVGFLGTLTVFVIKITPFDFFRRIQVSDYVEFVFNVFLFFPFILFFTLLLYWLPAVYWQQWWRFARIAIPIIFFLSILINLRLHHSPGGIMNFDNILDVPALILMYSIFTLGSLWKLSQARRGEVTPKK